MSSQKIVFTNSSGEVLSARLELPIDQKPNAYTIFAHCFTCSKNLNAVKNISKALTSNGFGVLRFDFTGLGESEGDFENTNFSSNVSDLVAAAQYLEDNFDAPKLLIGHSLGGAAVVFASKEIGSIEAVATIGAPSDPEHVQHLFKSKLEEIQEKKIAKVEIGGREFGITKQFLDDLTNKKMSETVRTLRKPLLIMHSPQDKTVGIENAAEIYASAKHPKSFISLDGADHLLSDKKDSNYVGNVIAGWATRYIDTSEKAQLKTKHQVVVQIGDEGLTTEILAGRHRLRVDEPLSVGGNDYGPTPYDLLLASLGACTAMTLRMYSDRKKWDVGEINVHLQHNKVHAKDCSDCESSNAKIDIIQRTIEIKGSIDPDQQKRLLEIADKCPVHRSLHGEMIVKTELT